MSEVQDRLYNLLPAIYRRRDAERGEPLRALLAVVEEHVVALEGDIEQLYRDWFIETCADWVVPYIGDLLGVEGIQNVESADFSLRAFVGNTIAYRRRKGTVGVIEELAGDVTGWPARAVEFFQRLDTTQHLDHVRDAHHRTFDVRDANAMELLGGPLGRDARTVGVRRIDTHGGRYNISNLGVFLWRLQVFRQGSPWEGPDPDDPDVVNLGVTARFVPGSLDPRLLWYRFEPHALDLDAPLFNHHRSEDEGAVAHLAEEEDLPGVLRARELARVLRTTSDLSAPDLPYLGWNPVLQIVLDDVPVPATDLQLFERWERADGVGDDWASVVPTEGKIAVDPGRGRLVVHLAAGADPPDEVTVSFHSASPGEVGAGPYDRPGLLDGLSEADPDRPGGRRPRYPDFQRGVRRAGGLVSGEVVNTLTEAIEAWNTHAAIRWGDGQPSFGIICLMDNRTYEEDVSVVLKPHGELWIVAADWPREIHPPLLPPNLVRRHGSLSPSERRPHLRGTVRISGEAQPDQPGTRPKIRLDGVQIEGNLVVERGDLGQLRFDHATLIPQASTLRVAAPGADVLATGNVGLELSLEASVLGDVEGPETVEALSARRCVLGAVTLPGSNLRVDGSTVLGSVSCRTITGSNDLFLEPVDARQRQKGCLRFCYVPQPSRTPRRFRCQPDLALAEAPEDRSEQLLLTIQPTFTSSTWGYPGFAQLRRGCVPEIRQGAEDGGEMGVWHHLQHPQRESNLRAALEQYLRVGFEAGFFYVT